MADDNSVMDSKPNAPVQLEPAAAAARVTINISGRRYETYDAVLRRLPHTLLGNERRRAVFWDASREEFFFDRCASSFEGILLAHQTGGDAWQPVGVPLRIFIEDLKFFGLTDQAARLETDGGGGHGPAADRAARPSHTPPVSGSTSAAGSRLLNRLKQQRVVVASHLATQVAVVAYVVGTLWSVPPEFSSGDHSRGSMVKFRRDNFWRLLIPMIVELFCMTIVLCECFPRAVAGKGRFCTDPINIIDAVVTVPFIVLSFATFYLGIEQVALHYKPIYWMLNVTRVLRPFRVLRILRETESSQLLTRALVASAPAFGVIFVVWMMAVVFFASFLHWIDWTEAGIPSIPLAMYWAIITMTTVGFGDIYPVTPASRFFGSVCAYTGYVMAALPIAVYVTKLAQCSREDPRDSQPTVHVSQGAPRADRRIGGVEAEPLTHL